MSGQWSVYHAAGPASVRYKAPALKKKRFFNYSTAVNSQSIGLVTGLRDASQSVTGTAAISSSPPWSERSTLFPSRRPLFLLFNASAIPLSITSPLKTPPRDYNNPPSLSLSRCFSDATSAASYPSHCRPISLPYPPCLPLHPPSFSSPRLSRLKVGDRLQTARSSSRPVAYLVCPPTQVW